MARRRDIIHDLSPEDAATLLRYRQEIASKTLGLASPSLARDASPKPKEGKFVEIIEELTRQWAAAARRQRSVPRKSATDRATALGLRVIAGGSV